jgi:hypothetical protein
VEKNYEANETEKIKRKLQRRMCFWSFLLCYFGAVRSPYLKIEKEARKIGGG